MSKEKRIHSQILITIYLSLIINELNKVSNKIIHEQLQNYLIWPLINIIVKYYNPFYDWTDYNLENLLINNK